MEYDIILSPGMLIFLSLLTLFILGSIWWSIRVVPRKGLPVRKSVNEFEILDVNRIPNTPLEYAYTLDKNSRVIQVESEEALQGAINQGLISIYYIKKADSNDFILFGSEKQDQLTIKEWQLNQLNEKINQQKRGWIQLLIYFVVTMILIVFIPSNTFDDAIETFVVITCLAPIFWLLPLFFLFYLRKIKTRKFEDLRA